MNDILLAALIGFSGVIIGTVITSVISVKIKSKETKLRILEKVFDKRIEAHENILFLIKNIRTVTSTGKADSENNLISFPSSMTSKEDLDKFINEVFILFHKNAHWLNTDLEREFWFALDYLTSLTNIIQDANNKDFPSIGEIVKQDFIDLATGLENITFDFFRKDIYDMKINKHDEWHKYPKEKTYAKLNETNLIKRKNEIERIIKNVA